ncbi:helix-turn-helix domain-containing protein [Pontiellaceae bacterium B12227]|nr:helix-turn-helix domain-containing protein [Pontiellaceae bacterium B12227]
MDEPILFSKTFKDFDELNAETKAWNIEISKLDNTPFHGKIFQFLSSDFLIGRGKFNGHLKQLGHPPTGFRTITVPAHPEFWMYWRGREVHGNNLMVFPLGSGIDTVSDPRFDIYTISVVESTLFGLADRLGFRGLEKFLKTQDVLLCDPARMSHLRSCLHQSEAESEKRVPDATSTRNRVLIRLIEALCTAKGDTTSNTASLRRLHAIATINRFIMESPDEIPTIKELCKLTKVSKRTLEYAFQEHYGILPKAYINAMRLNGARRVLRTTNSVADAANAWGFWHMGQFAKDYRKLFGELPSETLRH